MSGWPVRPADPADLPALADLWHAAWHEAHAAHVPEGLVRLRTRADFLRRLEAMADRVRTAGPVGAPLGFCAVRAAEIDQLFVAPGGRGTGLAARLLSDGEARLARAGIRRGLLLCIPGNARARAFYARAGWQEVGVGVEALETAEGAIRLAVLRLEKALRTNRTPA